MSFAHAIALFVFASRAFYGVPTAIYYQSEMAATTIYILLAATTSAPALKHFRFFLITFLLFLAIFLSAILARINFGQPLIYGMLARRDLMVSVIPAYFLIYGAGVAKTEHVVRNLALLVKIYVVAAFLLPLTIDPEIINTALSGNDELRLYFVDFNASLSAYRLKLSPLPGFLFLVHFFSKERRERSDFYLLVVFFVWLALFYGGRIVIASIIILYVALALSSLRKKSGFARVILSIFIVLVLVISAFVFLPDAALESRISGFSQAIDVVIGSGTTNIIDESSLARASQYSQLSDMLDVTDFFFGLGQLSTQWNGGFGTVFGRFHPSDLGLYGFLAIFGLAGVPILLAIMLILFSARIARKKNFRPLLIFFVVYSIPTGLILFHPSFVLICMLILYWVRENSILPIEQQSHICVTTYSN